MTKRLSIRVTPELYGDLGAEAYAKSRSINEEVNARLNESFERERAQERERQRIRAEEADSKIARLVNPEPEPLDSDDHDVLKMILWVVGAIALIAALWWAHSQGYL